MQAESGSGWAVTVEQEVLPSGGGAVAELHKALKEDGGLQKRVEGWKEGLEKQSIAHGVRGASLHQKCLGSTLAC